MSGVNRIHVDTSMTNDHQQRHSMTRLQHRRRLLQMVFFLIFILAPPLDLFRFDLTQSHFVVLGATWSLGLDAVISGEVGATQAFTGFFIRGLLPLAFLVGLFIWVSWRYGRLYCGWLCPHFSVVEWINGLMRRATGKSSLWDRKKSPETRADGQSRPVNRLYWLALIASVLVFSFTWALVLLTYLLPPVMIYNNLIQGTLTFNQSLFLSVGTVIFALEFMFARHLFCRFGCAVGVFQSLVWMGNRKAMVVGFDRKRSDVCKDCQVACEHECPMRLKPRSIKRKMFTCTECGRCLSACEQVQEGLTNGRPPLLQWVQDECALDVSSRDFGVRPQVPCDCYKR